MNKKGRPKKQKSIEELSFTTFQDDITIFKNYLVDSLDEEECYHKDIIKKFLEMEQWKQNIFIVYLLNKDRKFTFASFAELMHVDKSELLRTIKRIKKELLEL